MSMCQFDLTCTMMANGITVMLLRWLDDKGAMTSLEMARLIREFFLTTTDLVLRRRPV